MENFYNLNARIYFNKTVNNNLEEIYEPFLSQVPNDGRILDLGCGSGRDSKYFNEKGYQVIGVDGSIELVNLANKYTGLDILCSEYKDLNLKPSSFDGIWCCASLLHLSRNELPSILIKLKTWLKANGVLYASFKYGDKERKDGNRFFNDLNEEYYQTNILPLLEMTTVKIWKTVETRNDQEIIWFNFILKK